MSNQGKLPLLLFNTAVDFSTWTNGVGTPVVTGGQADPLGGTNAYSVNDDDGVTNIERLDSPAFSLTKNASGEAIAQLFVKKGTSTESHVALRDTTAGQTRHDVRVTWSGSAPVLATISGVGTLFTPVKVTSTDWYLIRFSATNIVTGNSHKVRLEPAGLNAAATGTIIVYGRSAVLCGLHLDNARSWPQPREGSEWVTAPSGVEDAWIVGTDYMLEGEMRWIPTLDVDSPHNRTGWDGRREHALVNAGWSSLLDYASGVTATVVFVPDRDDATANHNVYIEEPREDLDRRPDLEDDTTRRFTLVLRDSDDLPFEGY